ncbi:MAG: hypothetical protein ACLSWY_13410, partial [Ruthenibacterium lactatiformans]
FPLYRLFFCPANRVWGQTVEKDKEVKEKSGGKSWRWQSHASLRSKVQATRRMPPKRGGESLFHLK